MFHPPHAAAGTPTTRTAPCWGSAIFSSSHLQALVLPSAQTSRPARGTERGFPTAPLASAVLQPCRSVPGRASSAAAGGLLVPLWWGFRSVGAGAPQQLGLAEPFPLVSS